MARTIKQIKEYYKIDNTIQSTPKNSKSVRQPSNIKQPSQIPQKRKSI